LSVTLCVLLDTLSFAWIGCAGAYACLDSAVFRWPCWSKSCKDGSHWNCRSFESRMLG